GQDRTVDLELNRKGQLEGTWTDGKEKLSAVFQKIDPDPQLQFGFFANEDVVEKPDAYTRYISNANYDQPLPRAIPGVPSLSTRELQELMQRESRVVLLDAFNGGGHMSLPNSAWISDLGVARIGAAEQGRIDAGLKTATERDYDRPIVIFERS